MLLDQRRTWKWMENALFLSPKVHASFQARASSSTAEGCEIQSRYRSFARRLVAVRCPVNLAAVARCPYPGATLRPDSIKEENAADDNAVLQHVVRCYKCRPKSWFGLTLGLGRSLMHGVAPQMCGRVASPLLGRGAGGRSPGFLII